jgi:RHS repeat-associated protein
MIKNGIRYLFVTDHVGSVRLVVNADTGAVVQSIEYDAWGNVMLANNHGFQPFGFAGGLYDRDTKLVRFGARDYDPEVGRWTAKDPILFNGGQTNLYAYVANDPVSFVDPTGTDLADWYGFPSEDEHRNRNAHNV